MHMTMVLKSIKKYVTISKQKSGVKKVTKESKKIKEEAKAETEETKVVAQTVASKEKTERKEEGKVGLLLKEMRSKQGKTLSEISQDLCIRPSYLEAIENSDYNNIPEYPYGIGFIRSYADYLGLDGSNIVKMYKDEAEADFRKNHPYFVMEPQVEATVPNRKYLLISLIALIVIYGAWSAYNQLAYTSTEDKTPEETIIVEDNNVNFPLKVEDYSTNVEAQSEEEKTSEEKTSEENAISDENLQVIDVTSTENSEQVVVTDKSFVEPEAQKSEPKTEPENKKEAQDNTAVETAKPAKSGLTVNVLKETWIEVKNEKTLYISKVLQAGDSYTLPKADNLKLSVGRADGVEVMYNGKKAYEFSPNKKMNISVDEIIAGAQD